MIRYNNYHKHTMYSNLRTLDCVSKPIDYINRAKELGHTTYFTTEHGYQGNIFEAFSLCQENGLKCIYGVEAYYVNDIREKSSRSMYHLILVAMTENARKEINRIMSIANTDGYYYRPRIDKSLLLSLPSKEVVVTTACIASPLFRMDNWEEEFLIPIYNHFKDNLFLEVQAHVDIKQIEYNRKILELHDKYNIKLIHANDSHYILPEDSKYRDLFLKAKEMVYEDEGGFCLDYPSSDSILKRYEEQGVLTKSQAIEALENTLVFDKSEGINIDKEFKIPKITDGDSNETLRDLINQGWLKERENIPREKWKEYIEQIKYEYKIVEDCGMADYFILDHYVVDKAVNKYGAILTRSGRGSAVSFYINKLLGLTEVDRIGAPIKLYPTRFMSAERILSSRSLPDIDLNFADVTPVIKASKDLLGEDGIYYMIAYKPLQESSAFRLWCKANDMHVSEYDEVAKNLEEFENSKEWKDLIEESKVFRGVIESVAPSPCSFLLSNDKISQEVGLLKVGDEICCCLDGYNCDVYKYLKNDYLTVTVYQLISDTYKMIGRKIDDINSLVSKCDDKVWNIYADGMTTTINQADSDYDKQILKKYKPRNLSELSAYVAAIRPGFASLLNNFIERKEYSTGVKELDDILEDSFHYLMYQESIMKYLVWLGIEEKGTYDIIKKIAKKKFKEDELKALKEKLLAGWVNNVGKEDGFSETWQVVEDAAHYSFNASHSLSVAIDSLYGAYLKVNYPIEYFTVALTSYNGDLTRTANLINEMPYFNLQLKPIKFRHSRADYNMDKTNNTIYKGLKSIKYLNEQVAEDLYALRDKQYDSFLDFLPDFTGNSRQLEILIKLGYFDEFGPAGTLLKIIEYYDKYKCTGKTKQFKKDSLPLESIMYIEKHAIKETEKQYVLSAESVKDLLRDIVNSMEAFDIKLRDKIEAESEYLGYISIKIPDAENNAYVIDLEQKSSNFKITLYDLFTGETKTLKLKKKVYQNTPVQKNDIISYRLSEEYPWFKDEDGKWQQDFTKEKQPILGWYGINRKWD